MQPWLDYSRRLSPLKLLVFASLFLPGAWTAAALAFGLLGAEPMKEALHELGLWTLRFLLIALAITPARQTLQWPRRGCPHRHRRGELFLAGQGRGSHPHAGGEPLPRDGHAARAVVLVTGARAALLAALRQQQKRGRALRWRFG
jgi:hypothetical protein